VLECEQLYVDAHCQGGALHWMSAFHTFCSEWLALRSFFSVLQYTSDVTVVPCCMNSTINTSFLSNKPGAISFPGDVCLNLFGLFHECVCIHCFDWSLVSTITNETQISSPVTCMMWLRNSLPSLWYHSQKAYKSRSHSLCFVRTHAHFRSPCCTKLVIA
jgi:hypothetical protein